MVFPNKCREHGAAAFETALTLAIIAILAIGSLRLIGSQVSKNLQLGQENIQVATNTWCGGVDGCGHGIPGDKGNGETAPILPVAGGGGGGGGGGGQLTGSPIGIGIGSGGFPISGIGRR